MKAQTHLDSHHNCHPDKVHLDDIEQVEDHVEAVDWSPGEEEDDAHPDQDAEDYHHNDDDNLFDRDGDDDVEAVDQSWPRRKLCSRC